jgi:uncharacterized repeat protein (TIGR01451 family)
VVVGASVTRPITLTVDNGYRVTAGSGAGINPPFSFALGTCGAGGGFVGPGTCTIQETFAPTTAGAAGGTLTVSECPVAGGGCLGIDVALNGHGISVLSIATASLPNGVIGVPYSATLQTNGGTPPATWSITAGALPLGLTLDPVTGSITGTPAAPVGQGSNAPNGTGVFAFTVSATDAGLPAHQTATRALSITILSTADLALELDAPKQAKTSKTLTFTLTVQNLGPHAAGAIVTDALPPQTTFVSAETKDGTCAASAGMVTCTLNPLAAGKQAKIKITVEAPPIAGSISNTASVAVSGSAIDPVPANNSAAVTVQVK